MSLSKILLRLPSLRAGILLGFGTSARILAGFTKTKFAAVFLGASGVGLLGIGGQVQLLGLTWGSLSISAGFIRAYGSALESGNTEKRKRVLSTSLTLLCGANAVVLVSMGIFHDWLGESLFGSKAYGSLVLASIVGIPFQVLIGAYLQGILFSHEQYEQWTRANAAGAVLEVIAFVTGVYFFGLVGAFWALGISMICWSGCVLWYCAKLESVRDLFTFGFSREIVRELATSSLATSATSSFAYLSGMIIRVKLLAHYGGELNGIYQASCIVSGLYTQLVMNAIWARLYPLASKRVSEGVLNAAWAESLLVTAGMGAMFQTGILIAPHLLFSLFFSHKFEGSVNFLAWQLWGDFFFLLAQPGMAVLLARGRFKPYAAAWCFFYSLSVLFPLFTFSFLGSYAVTIAYLFGSILLCGFSLVPFIVRRPILMGGFLPSIAAFGIATSIAALPFLLPFDLGALGIGARLAGFLLAFGLFIRMLIAGHEPAYSYLGSIMMIKTKTLNLFRKSIITIGADGFLAWICASIFGSSWLIKCAPNHYQYPQPTLRRVRRNGFQFALNLGDFLDWHIYFGKMEGAKNKLYELATTGTNIIDVGANIGETALHLARKTGAGGRVFAFEPDPVMREKCRKNLGLNVAANVQLESYALSDESRNHYLHRVSERNPAGNRILPDGVVSENQVEVMAVTLDEFVEKNSIHEISLVKIDVEGFEYRVVVGAKRLLKMQRPKLFIELSDGNLRAQGNTPSQLVEILHELDYVVLHSVTGAEFTADTEMDKIHCDVVCLPKPDISISSDLTFLNGM